MTSIIQNHAVWIKRVLLSNISTWENTLPFKTLKVKTFLHFPFPDVYHLTFIFRSSHLYHRLKNEPFRTCYSITRPLITQRSWYWWRDPLKVQSPSQPGTNTDADARLLWHSWLHAHASASIEVHHKPCSVFITLFCSKHTCFLWLLIFTFYMLFKLI